MNSITSTLRIAQGEIADDTRCCVVSIGHVAREIRKNIGFSQREISKVLQVDFMWLSKMENDRLEVSDETEQMIASLLPMLARLGDVDVEWLQELAIVDRRKPNQVPQTIDRFT